MRGEIIQGRESESTEKGQNCSVTLRGILEIMVGKERVLFFFLLGWDYRGSGEIEERMRVAPL